MVVTDGFRFRFLTAENNQAHLETQGKWQVYTGEGTEVRQRGPALQDRQVSHYDSKQAAMSSSLLNASFETAREQLTFTSAVCFN
jgi:hypothetical protein